MAGKVYPTTHTGITADLLKKSRRRGPTFSGVLLGTAGVEFSYASSGTITAGSVLDLVQNADPFIYASTGDPDIAVVTSPAYGIKVSASDTPALYIITSNAGLQITNAAAGEDYYSTLSVAGGSTPPIFANQIVTATGAFYAFNGCQGTTQLITGGADTWGGPDILVWSTATASRTVHSSAGGAISSSFAIARFGLP